VGGGTVSATVTVVSSSGLSITDPSAHSSYKFNNNPQGPVGGLNNYVGYNGFSYSSQARPIKTGYFRASNQLGDAAGCPFEYDIFRCTTCGTVPEYATRPQGNLTGNMIIPGSTGQLTYYSSNGGGPFTLVYQPSGGSNITVNNISSTVAFNVASGTGTPITTTIYKLMSVTDENTNATTDFSGKIATVYVSSDYVTIGTQIWTNKNLDVTTYRNGDPIPQVTDPTAWAGLTTGAWCYYNDDPANGAIYGKLYNWYAVNDPRGLAPAGWHVPTETEWQTLIGTLGGASVAGGEMKSTGTTYWGSPNTGTNSSGFSALPGGLRDVGGNFFGGGPGGVSTMWSSTSLTVSTSRNFFISSSDDIISFDGEIKRGKTVRLVKD
jgi:uncharacterized protein (TIGR02145 family)